MLDNIIGTVAKRLGFSKGKQPFAGKAVLRKGTSEEPRPIRYLPEVFLTVCGQPVNRLPHSYYFTLLPLDRSHWHGSICLRTTLANLMAYSMALIKLLGLAVPNPAWSKAVP